MASFVYTISHLTFPHEKAVDFFATCALGLLANTTPAQTTPLPVYSSCANSDYSCWADTGYDRVQAFGRNKSMAACIQRERPGPKPTITTQIYNRSPTPNTTWCCAGTFARYKLPV
jgi:hypothetical protein